jgi:glucan phosphoethanolaminetransferase (alkaline phosphatase superfamily)
VRERDRALKINEREVLRLINQRNWLVPFLIAVLATPFMMLAITTQDENLEIFAKLVWLVLLLIFLAYNLLHKYLRKKYEGRQGGS